jgi:hypothetical protein
MTAAVYVVSHVLTDRPTSVAITAATALMFFALWFWLPLTRRSRDRRR